MELSERQRSILWSALQHYRATVQHSATGQGMDPFLKECDEILTALKETLPAVKALEEGS